MWLKPATIDMKETLQVIQTGGSSIVHCNSLFSHDLKYLICPCGNLIKVFSIESGECFQRLIGHSEAVSGICHHPKIILQILSSSLDGTVKVWDYEDGVLLVTCKFSYPLKGIFSHSRYPNVAFVVQKNEKSHEFCRFVLDTIHPQDGETACEMLAKNISGNCNKLISLSEKYAAVSYNNRFLIFNHPENVKRNEKIRHLLKDNEPPIMCITCNPKKEFCATGHTNGEIRIWFNVSDALKVVSNIQHWHSLEVLSLCFSSSGSSLLSGGHEGVLVQWREENRSFLPRLGSSISNIAVSDNNTLYAVSLSDNSILVITNYFTVKQTFEGFTATNQTLPSGLQYDPTTTAYVTNGKPGHLLFYHPKTDAQLYNLDIISRNFISSVDLQKPLSRTTIVKVAFIKTATKENYMATIEFDRDDRKDQKLKFWSFGTTEQQWILETIVASPHDNHDISSLIFHPTEPMCVTTSHDGFMKFWVKEDYGWMCDTTTSYRSYSCFGSSFSEDGSVLAVAFGKTVLLCEASNTEKMNLLVSHTDDIMCVQFGSNASSHLLIIASYNLIQCWDVISYSLVWCCDVLKFKFLISDYFSENMAVFTDSNKVFVFRPSEKIPLYTQTLSVDVVAACFVHGGNPDILWEKDSQLYFVSKEMIVHKFCLSSKVEDILPPRSHSIEGSTPTAMATLLSTKINTLDEELFSESLQPNTTQETLQYILETPCHLLPSMSVLCERFISSLLLRSSNEKDEEPIEKVRDDDVPNSTSVEKDRNDDLDEVMEYTNLSNIETGKNTVDYDNIHMEDFEWLKPVFQKKFINTSSDAVSK